jgi:methyl-accepting chemotaxis protein
MRTISQQVERSSQEQARGGRRITEAIESINNMVSELNQAQRDYSLGSDHALALLRRVNALSRQQKEALKTATKASSKLGG